MIDSNKHDWSYYQKNLETISECNGVPYGRAYRLFDEEEKHFRECLQFKGYLALSDAFKCIFIETIELFNDECHPNITKRISEPYVLFIPRFVNCFKSLCGSERLALKGYPLPAYALLRNIYDNLVVLSAVLQGITDFRKIDGIDGVNLGEKINQQEVRKKRINAEKEVRLKMTGNQSGLNKTAIEELKILDDMFDWETHGARLSIAASVEWLQGKNALSVLPKFVQREFAIFMNRYCEIAWMLHRLIPMIQTSEAMLGKSWQDKWHVVDESFQAMVDALTKQAGKQIGTVLVEFVTKKFPFNEKSVFPL